MFLDFQQLCILTFAGRAVTISVDVLQLFLHYNHTFKQDSVKDEPFTRRFVSARCSTQSLLCAKSRAEMEDTMKTVKISLNSIDKVKSFVNDITKFDTDFDLVSGRYVIDAKSIMGIFSLDLSKSIDLNIHGEEDIDEILAALKKYEA